MDDISKQILGRVGILVDSLDGQFIPRELLLDNNIYVNLKEDIVKLKKLFSSSALTSLQQTATLNQKWPLLNLIRQILHSYHYEMKPIRKSDGYTKDKIKKYKRFFLISLQNATSTNEEESVKQIKLENV